VIRRRRWRRAAWRDGRGAARDGGGPAGCHPARRRARLILVAAGASAGFLALAGRCAQLQILDAKALLERARSQRERTITLDPPRGTILDRAGRELALSLEVDSAFADPSAVGDPEAAARRLAPVLGLKASELRSRLAADRSFVWLRRKIDPGLRRRIEALGMRGIGFVRESRRYYPKRTLAAHVVGACGIDNQGLAGLEFAYDAAVKGVPGRMRFVLDGRGARVLDRSRTEATPGQGLLLTVDEVIQHHLERELDAVMAAARPRGAAAVVLRPQTGEILALASRPTFDPNGYSATREEARRNRAVSDYYEPGSTFKVITAAAALDLGRVRPNEAIWCENGSIVVARHRFSEDRRPFGSLTFTEVLARSSNVGAIKVARRLEASEWHAAISAFGFGRRTGIDLPGESPGMLRDPADWSGLSQASLAIGQEVGATTVQLAAALGAVANDGVWVRPRVVEALVAADGRRLPPRTGGERDRRRVIAGSTARALRRMLQAVTTADGGTGRAAAVPGYSVAGKTGTAQKVDQSGRYARGRYVSWFAGLVPAADPALVIVVMVDEPRGPRFHGGDVAAPVFARVALPALRYLQVPPDGQGTLLFDRSGRAAAGAEAGAPFEASAVGAARATAAPAGAVRALDERPGGFEERPGVVVARAAGPARLAPALAARPPDGRHEAAAAPPAAGPRAAGVMPDLEGMSLRQATETLAAAGIACQNLKAGPRVTRQHPAAGTAVGAVDECRVVF
jgi:cell division protein FtsI (penicillin-binding protein 3)